MASTAVPEDPVAYDAYIESMRQHQYPMLKDSLYLDHAGTTLPSKSLLEHFHNDMLADLYGNPHSASPSSQASTHRIEDIRLQVLKFFNADPEAFDLVFTANATQGIKLVADALRDSDGGFWYGYHVDSHTSLVGARELARESMCFESDDSVQKWVDAPRESQDAGTELFAYPAQSNMNGRRLPLAWCRTMREKGIYSLLDAAAYVSTSPLPVFRDFNAAPDFTVVSFYKIFGFPDLGALIVKKDASHLLQKRKYFGGGTVDMVVCSHGEKWHATKTGSLHAQLEDGTLPVHSILALRSALSTHRDLFDTMERVSRHTARLAKQLYDGLKAMKHPNTGVAVCTTYAHINSNYTDTALQGPIVAFNMRESSGNWVSISEVEKLAFLKDIHLRTGGLCNPGGIATSLALAPWEMRENFSAGYRCGSEDDTLNGKPTGVIRVSLGAMSTASDVNRFLDFIREYFVAKATPLQQHVIKQPHLDVRRSRLQVESLTVYPIKSCAGWTVPYDMPWNVRREGLAWDREWCIVHQGSNAALSQKQYPRMALIRPSLDFNTGKLRIRLVGRDDHIVVPLSMDRSYLEAESTKSYSATVCGDTISAWRYTSPTIADTLTDFLGVACTLARFPAASSPSHSTRHSKAHLHGREHQHRDRHKPQPLLLSNESPILTITRSSLNKLNESLKARSARAAHPSVFRANIVLSESPHLQPGAERPWAEDEWERLRFTSSDGAYTVDIDVLGGCRRCQMVCVDQESGERKPDVFLTLAKMRRIGGKVLFGVHGTLAEGKGHTIRVGDAVHAIER